MAIPEGAARDWKRGPPLCTAAAPGRAAGETAGKMAGEATGTAAGAADPSVVAAWDETAVDRTEPVAGGAAARAAGAWPADGGEVGCGW